MGVRPVSKLTPVHAVRAVAAGIVAAAAALPWLGVTWQSSVVVLLLAAAAVRWVSSIRLTALVLVGVAAVLVRGAFLPLPPPSGAFLGPQTFTATVVAPPRLGERSTRYIVEPMDGRIKRVLLVAHTYPAFRFGDTVRVSCENVVDELFPAYRDRQVFRECAFPELTFIGTAPAGLRGTLLALRDAAGARLKLALPEPYGSLATGMLWGDDSELPHGVVEAFRRTGTSHLTAVSGYNVMVLSEVLFWVLVALGLWRRSASAVVLAALLLFVLFTGAEPAVVRAGIMSALVVVARLVGRRPDKLNLLLGAAAAMLLVAPALVRDLGFQLSFAAMAGLLYAAPLLHDWLRVLPTAFGLREAAAQTLAATLATTPVILFRLGTFSVLSPIANVLVGPVVVVIFGLGLPLLVVSFVHPIIASPFAVALSAVLWYVVWVVEGLATLPWASSVATPVTWLVVAMVYLGFGWLVIRHQRASV